MKHVKPNPRPVLVTFALVVVIVMAGCQPAAPAAAPAAVAAAVTAAPTEIPPTPTETPAPPTATPTEPPTMTPTASPSPSPTVTFTPSPAPTPQGLDKTENILVLGTDHRPGPWASRTDTMMVVAIDHAAGQVGIISIPRDLWVDIPGWGKDRINSAEFAGDQIKYQGGGVALAQRVVEENLGIPTSKYVRIRQDGLPKLVDAVGGVTVTLECPLYERTPSEKSPTGYEDFSLPAGDVFLDGPTAKKFVTYRYLSNDFSRARRQQQLIWALRNLSLNLDLIPRIPELWDALQGTFKTDLNPLDVVKLARLGLALEPEQVHSLVLDQEVVKNYTTPGGGAVLVIKDPQVLKQKLDNLFSGKTLSELGKNIPGGCPPAPKGMKAWPTLTPTITLTPEVTATPEITATATITATVVVTATAEMTATASQ
jgi:LCP family protein required for cell wall assembly